MWIYIDLTSRAEGEERRRLLASVAGRQRIAAQPSPSPRPLLLGPAFIRRLWMRWHAVGDDLVQGARPRAVASKR